MEELTKALAKLGYKATSAESDATFGDTRRTFTNGKRTLIITRDRSQYILEGDREELESAGLWRAFELESELLSSLVQFLKNAE